MHVLNECSVEESTRNAKLSLTFFLEVKATGSFTLSHTQADKLPSEYEGLNQHHSRNGASNDIIYSSKRYIYCRSNRGKISPKVLDFPSPKFASQCVNGMTISHHHPEPHTPNAANPPWQRKVKIFYSATIITTIMPRRDRRRDGKRG